MTNSRWDIKVTSKGQITIPKEVRDIMMVREGDYLEAAIRDDSVILTRKVEPGGPEKARYAALHVLRELGYGESGGEKVLPDRMILREKIGKDHPNLSDLVRRGRDEK